MKQPVCKMCGAKIDAPLLVQEGAADWVCLECSGASLSDFDDSFQTCEALQGCECEAWSLCRKCNRWLCGRHAGSHAHGCEVSVDEQYEHRRTMLEKIATQAETRRG